MKKITLIFILVSGLLFSQKSFKISGNISGFSDNAIVRITKDNLAIDSCKLKNGNFILKGELQNAPSGVYLDVKDGKEFKYAFLFIGNENISINTDINDFPFNVKTKGSKYDLKRFELVQKQKDLQIERSNLLEQMFSLRDQKKWNDSLQKDLWSKVEPLGKITKIDKEYLNIENDFIEKNINSYYALYRLNQTKTQIDSSRIVEILKKIKPEFKNSFYLKSINAHLKYPDLIEGQSYYNFKLTNSKGEKTDFAHFYRDNDYVLLDFSTIYCGFCISAIPELEKLKQENNNLKIVTFYVDSDERGFNNLKDKHKENWDIVWDKKGRLSETYAKYKVFGTPTFYLFTPDGKLLKKFDGLIENMSEEVSKLIQQTK